MLVSFEVAGDSNQAQANVTAALAAAAATQADHPQLRVEEFGSASANKALIKAYDGDFNRAEHTSLPITLLILLIAFGSLVAAGVPLLLGFTAVIGALGSDQAHQPPLPCGARTDRARRSCWSGSPSAWTTPCSTCGGSSRSDTPAATAAPPWPVPPPRRAGRC